MGMYAEISWLHLTLLGQESDFFLENEYSN